MGKPSNIATVHYLDGVAIESDFLYLATQLDSLNPREVAHTRMSTYTPKNPHPSGWGYHDMECNIVSVYAYRSLPQDRHRYVSLERHGDVFFRRGGATKEIRKETLPGAGFLGGNLGGLMSHLREIGGHLWACGQFGQVFRRFAPHDWRHVDQGLFVPIDPKDYRGRASELVQLRLQGPNLNCIDGNTERDVYAVGDRGLMVHFDGQSWSRVKVPTDEHLQWVRCYGQEVWVCGFNGTLLVGNAKTGFKDVSTIDDNQTWVCLSKFAGKVYLSEIDGLWCYDGQGIAPVKTGLKPELQDAWRVDHADGVLWSIGIKDLARFDGQRWQRIVHPDNGPIGGV